MKDFFKAEDFVLSVSQGRGDFVPVEQMHANYANAKLKAYVQCLDKLYGDSRLGHYHGKPVSWSIDETEHSTHFARVLPAERIEK